MKRIILFTVFILSTPSAYAATSSQGQDKLGQVSTDTKSMVCTRKGASTNKEVTLKSVESKKETIKDT